LTRAKVTMVSSLNHDPVTGKFVKGHSGPGGRPRFSRNKLSYALIEALSEDFDQFGAAAVRKVREHDTATYLRIIAATMPAKIESTLEVNNNFNVEIRSPQEFTAAYRLVKQAREFIGVDKSDDIIDVELEEQPDAEQAID
jgi:hypothetical protein